MLLNPQFYLMKKKASFRIDEQLHEKLKEFANSEGITTSQLIELACYHFMEEKPKPTKQIERHKKLETINVTLRVDQPTYRKLANIIQSKNSTLSQELNYRLSATLEEPVFDIVEFNELWAVKFDVDRLGNLLRWALKEKREINENLLIDLDRKVTSLRDEFREILTQVRKRRLLR